MKKLKIFLWIVIISFFSFASAEYTTTTSSSNWYNTPIIDGSIEFKAEQDNGKVYTKWTVYDKDEKFKYYKVIRSQKVENPVYPDHGYIKYDSSVNNTEFIDYKAPKWINYYRVCAITYESNRYCSNVVKIDIEKLEENLTICTMEYAPVCGKKGWVLKTYSNKCMLKAAGAEYKYYWKCKDTTINNDSWLDYKLKSKADILVKKLLYKIDKKAITNNAKVELLKWLIIKLELLASKKPALKPLIEYINEKLNNQITSYQDDFSDIEDIFNEY